MLTIGDTLLDLVDDARSEVILVAPFMKAAVVSRIVQAVAPNVRISCITRWRPHEIKAGINDLEIWDVLRSRSDAKILLIPTLHAKYYRADHRYAIGSANLTKLALGWAPRPNVELLIGGKVDTQLREWESCLLAQGIEVDDALVRHFKRLVDNLPTPEFILSEHNYSIEDSLLLKSVFSSPVPSSWLPILRYPEQLYDVYTGYTEEISAGAREAAVHDLLALTIPRGLNKTVFQAEVAATLLQMPLIRKVDRFLSQPRRFGAVRDFLRSLEDYPEGSDPTTTWQNLMRWLRYFLPSRYQVSVPRHSEVMFRID